MTIRSVLERRLLNAEVVLEEELCQLGTDWWKNEEMHWNNRN